MSVVIKVAENTSKLFRWSQLRRGVWVTHQTDQVRNQQKRGLYEIDMTGWDDDEDEYDEDSRLQSSTHVYPAQLDSIDLAKEAIHI